MKRRLWIASCLVLATTLFGEIPNCPLKRGVNLTGWFEKGSATQILNQYVKSDFENLLMLGCDHIRLPIHMFNMTGDGPDYTINPLLFTLLDQPVDWAEELGLQLILDNHSFDPAIDTDPAILDQLISVWQQMAEHYKNRSTLIYYEILNEPHEINSAVWCDMQQQAIDAIRAIDTTHTLIIGPVEWNGYGYLSFMPEYSDDKLIYTFHFYDPFLFTHQGATWTDPSLIELAHVPFPYEASRMPDLPNALTGTWVENNYNSYPEDGNVDYIQSKLDVAIAFGTERQVPLYCGEFGAYQEGNTSEDRARWIQAVRTILENNDIAWGMWSYSGGFGLFEPGSNGNFNSDLDSLIVEALGFDMPPQETIIIEPDTTGFILYDDVVATGLIDASYLGSGIINYYDAGSSVEGGRCISWTEASQYNTITWQFNPTRDLSVLHDAGYHLNFWIKTDFPELRLDVRFLDTDLDDGIDHPWRMSATIDNSLVSLDGTWQEVDIPLTGMTDIGSWHNNAWYNSEGLFDWTRVDRIEFVAEHHDLKGITVFLDQIAIMSPDGAATALHSPGCMPQRCVLHPAYPNPFNPETRISYELPAKGHVNLKIYDINGRLVRELVNTIQNAGHHLAVFEASNSPSGFYLATLQTDKFKQTQKLVLIK